MPEYSIVDRLEYRGQIQPNGMRNTSDGNSWPIHLVRLSQTGDLTVHFDASNSSDADETDPNENGIKTYIWTIYLDTPWNVPGGAPQNGKETQVSSMVSHTFTHRFQNITVDPSTGFAAPNIRIELKVIDHADVPSLQNQTYKMYFTVVGEGYGDAEPDVEFISPAQGSSQTGDTLYVNGSILSGSENGDVTVEVALAEDTLDKQASDKYALRLQGEYAAEPGLGDDDTFSLELDISDLYDANGTPLTVWIKITEGNGDRWTIYKQIDVNLVPREAGGGVVDCDENPDDENCSSTTSEGKTDGGMSSLILFGGIGAFVLLIVILLTMFLVRGRSGESTSVDSFGGEVAQMDPVEAYVQQLVAQGYPEETARAYAQQYYAQQGQ